MSGKFCPLRLIAGAEDQRCIREKCAWFVDEDIRESCAVVVLVEVIDEAKQIWR